MGEDVWRSENEWPLARAVETEFFLSSGGNANSIAGDGALTNEASGDDRPDIFLYDPFHPVPTVGGQLCCYPATLDPGAEPIIGAGELHRLLKSWRADTRGDAVS